MSHQIFKQGIFGILQTTHVSQHRPKFQFTPVRPHPHKPKRLPSYFPSKTKTQLPQNSPRNHQSRHGTPHPTPQCPKHSVCTPTTQNPFANILELTSQTLILTPTSPASPLPSTSQSLFQLPNPPRKPPHHTPPLHPINPCQQLLLPPLQRHTPRKPRSDIAVPPSHDVDEGCVERLVHGADFRGEGGVNRDLERGESCREVEGLGGWVVRVDCSQC